jgi:hypothetical protein
MRAANLIVSAVVALSLVVPAAAAAQAKAKNQLLPNGTVKSVSASSLVVTALGKDTTFTVDANTRVVGKGIGTKSKAKADKPSIVDLVKEGDRVTVTYRDAGGTMHASRIEVASKVAR